MFQTNSIAKFLVTAALPLVLANCSSSVGDSAFTSTGDGGSDFQAATVPPPHPPIDDIVRVDFKSWGGFPGPKGALYTNLQLNLEASGAVSAKYESNSCASKMNITRAEFDAIVAQAGKSAYNIGVGSGAPDMATNTITLSNLKPTGPAPLTSHLSEDGTSRGERVLVDGPKVRLKINDLIVRLEEPCKATCLPK